MITATPLFELDDMTVFETVCRHGDPVSLPDSFRGEMVAFVRAGMFLYESEGANHVVDPHHLLFFDLADECRMHHPAACGDACVIIARRDVEPALRGTVRKSRDVDARYRELVCAMASGSPVLEIEAAAVQLWTAARTLSRVDRTPQATFAKTVHEDMAREVARMLTESLDRRLTLGDLARSVGVSPFHLCRVFSARTGQTIQRYHRRLRLHAAREAVIGGEKDLTRLALRLGFVDHSHLTRSFKREFGVPPSTLRIPAGGE